MKVSQGYKQALLTRKNNWPLIADLFNKWGYVVDKNSDIEVGNIETILAELSLWEIPFTRITWE